MAYTTINKSTDYFETKLITGTGSSQTITGLGFQPDWVWGKQRNASNSHEIYDVIRGVNQVIYSDLTDASGTNSNGVSAFTSDGFTVGNTSINASGGTAVAWNWKANGAGSANTDGSISSTVSANTTSGFSIVKWTGTGSNATVGHGLGSAPKIIIVKNLNASQPWWTYSETLGAGKQLRLNDTDVAGNDGGVVWNNTAPTSSVFSVGTNAGSNGSSNNIIAYCFAEKQGFSKFSSYTGNGNDDGTFIYTGFKPAFIMIKATGLTENWWIMDSKRSPSNVVQNLLQANLSNAELVGNVNFKFDMLSNGFKLRDVDGAYNSSGQNYIYMAFAEAPLVGTNNVPCTAR